MKIIGYVNDVNSDIVHIIFNDEDEVFRDAIYNISSSKFVLHSTIPFGSVEYMSYDADRRRMYLKASNIEWTPVRNEDGVLYIEPKKRVKLSTLNASDDIVDFSFSNGLYIVKKRQNNVDRYYVGSEESEEMVCISESSENDGLVMKFFVTSNERPGSTFSSIRAQLSPRPSPPVLEAVRSSESNTLSISLTLIIPLISTFFAR
ncbi:hypothetical protein AB6A40_006944 [Gnathostoma spinigerum]|uniref:Uncharacterized protein n=1 Tax=Gnathostoma spinigerum TaxID=75299 RepID=A0ABD6EVG4_9BILA